ncbi:MAG: ATP-dependent sacrificial sulfur transferase LarE [Deltaproteobacteria bacterium]|nr:ATP-dependent sacrificial sulfur transferase LarE [Deltaproteobacteria bacterium]
MAADAADARFARLCAWFEARPRTAIALSGGVDSGLLATAAGRIAPGQALALIARSCLLGGRDLAQAHALAGWAGARLQVVDFDPLSLPAVRANEPERCYFCKRALLEALLAAARGQGLESLADGSHADDQASRRPGRKAIEELGVRSPYLELGWRKRDLRLTAQALGMPGWDRPSSTCLATRVPYGQALDPARLERIRLAEEALEDMGFGQRRVRDHGPLACLELASDDLQRMGCEPGLREQVHAALHGLGWTWVSADLLGFRSGSMDEYLDGGGDAK